MEGKQDLEAFQAFLLNEAQFILLGAGKRPRYRYGSPDSKHRYSEIPKNSNYGVLPSGRLLVLDLDVGVNVEDQEKFFSKVFGFPLSETLNVQTPSGGRHYYLFAPTAPKKGESILPKGSLRGGIARALRREYLDYSETVKIDADLRSGQQNGYVVGPSSNVNEGYLLTLKPIKEIPEKHYERLTRVVSQYYLHTAQKLIKTDGTTNEEKLSLGAPPEWLYQSLEVGLSKRENQSYHSKRAVVKTLLGCCYDDLTVAGLCKSLKINRDSYRGKFLSDLELLQDLQRLQEFSSHGGPLCQKFSPTLKNKDGKKEQPRTLPYINRGIKVGKRRYRVLYMGLIERALARKVRRNSQVYRDAYGIVEHFLQPLSNFGAKKILLGHEELKRYFRISSSRVTAALRLLRQVGVVTIYRKPFPGSTTIYEIPKKWDDKALTKILKKTWFSHVLEGEFDLHPSVEFSSRERVFVDAITRQSLFEVSEKENNFTPSPTVPYKMGSVALSYLVNEVEFRLQPDGSFLESRPWGPDLTILATIDDAFFSGARLLEFNQEDKEENVIKLDLQPSKEMLPESRQLLLPLFLIDEKLPIENEETASLSFVS